MSWAIFRAAGLLLSRVDRGHASLAAVQILSVRCRPARLRRPLSDPRRPARLLPASAAATVLAAAADDDDDDDAYIIMLSHDSSMSREELQQPPLTED